MIVFTLIILGMLVVNTIINTHYIKILEKRIDFINTQEINSIWEYIKDDIRK
jgi:hypothetical protein